MRTMSALFGLLLVLALCGILRTTQAAAAYDVPRISKEEAKALLGKPNVVFLDARVDKAWKESSRQITGAVRVDEFDLETQAANFGKDAIFIIY
jgi:Rhodanese-like domain